MYEIVYIINTNLTSYYVDGAHGIVVVWEGWDQLSFGIMTISNPNPQTPHGLGLRIMLHTTDATRYCAGRDNIFSI